MPRIKSTGFSICPNPLLDQISEPGGKQRVCVYLMLHRFGNGNHDGCYASVTTLSKALGINRRDVMTAISWLLDNGWASYTIGQGRRRHIHVNADRQAGGAQKGTGSQKGTMVESAQKGTAGGDQKGTLSRTHNQEPSPVDVLLRSSHVHFGLRRESELESIKPKKRGRKPKAEAGYSVEFEAWWRQYQAIKRRASGQSKPKAWDEYRKALLKHPQEALEGALRAAVGEMYQIERNGGFASPFPDAFRWLRDGRYEAHLTVGVQEVALRPNPWQIDAPEGMPF
jgi:hypothetical protein